MTFFVYGKHHHFYNIANLDHFTGMTQAAITDLGNMDETILMNTDIHKHAKVDNVAHRTGQFHAGDQILHFQNVLTEDRLGQFITGIPAGFAQFLCDIQQGGFTHGAFGSSSGKTVSFQFGSQTGKITAFFAAQQIQKGFG